jgi:predicted AAA+ superfamily ATPase
MAMFERHLAEAIKTSLLDTPAVLINGPRQSGKTTLARQLSTEMPYYTLDDTGLLAAVRQDPSGFVQTLDRAVIDEVQRAPELMLALKMAIDQDRRPGRFLLTGSANLMALPQIADSLAGRMETHTLLPLSQAELQGRPSDFLQRAQAQDWPLEYPLRQEPLVNHVLAGGYPEMRQRATPARRHAWARAYINNLVERDVRDVANIDQLGQIPRLLQLLATRCGQLLNATQLGAQLGLDARTTDKYIGILERLFLVQRLPPWSHNDVNRLIKTPKLHFLDAGLQATLTRLTPALFMTQRELWGATLETWVYAELRKTLALEPGAWFISHYRDKDQVEVDFVLESPMRDIIAIEVKASATVQAQDFKGLRKLAAQTGKNFLTGIVLYGGTLALPFGDRLRAVPLAAL